MFINFQRVFLTPFQGHLSFRKEG